MANGDTRALTFLHTHTGERATITFRRDGRYDDQALSQLNWLLRDWRVDEPTKMDPHLFDILWEVYRETGSREPIQVISAYRSPKTNAMLRNRSKAVAEQSQHMAGKAMDIRLADVDTARLRAIAMRLQYGGVGYYPSSEFVHIDTGSVRAWPRMSQDQLARLFPDGKTLHLPSSGKPLARYEEAKAEILPRNAALASAGASGGSIGNLFAGLFRRNGPGEAADAPQPGADRATAVALASSDAAAPSDALAYAPLPPRRPIDLMPITASHDSPALSGVEVAMAGIGAVPAAPELPEHPPLDGLSVASRLLFSSLPLDATPPSGASVAAARIGPRLLASAGGSSLDLRFARQPRGDFGGDFGGGPSGDPGIARFTGPAVRPLPILRQANAAL